MGATDDYFAASAGYDLELERVQCMERVLDPITFPRLERISIGEGWKCLEVAAGAGSVAAWIGDRVGAQGSVLAIDVNTRFLDHLRPPIIVNAVDLVNDDIGSAAFDLVHSRNILHHLARPDETFEKMAAAVKPGGWLCIEEGDLGAARAVDLAYPGALEWTEQTRSICDRQRDAGVMDLFFGRRVRALIERTGFETVSSDGVTNVWRGGEDASRNWDLACEVLHAAGTVTDDERDLNRRLMNDPDFLFFGVPTLFGAWARRAT
jgi:SAM-dependent methyltransferase